MSSPPRRGRGFRICGHSSTIAFSATRFLASAAPPASRFRELQQAVDHRRSSRTASRSTRPRNSTRCSAPRRARPGELRRHVRAQQLGEALDGGERGGELVAHVRQELGLQPVGVRDLLVLRAQLLIAPRQLALEARVGSVMSRATHTIDWPLAATPRGHLDRGRPAAGADLQLQPAQRSSSRRAEAGARAPRRATTRPGDRRRSCPAARRATCHCETQRRLVGVEHVEVAVEHQDDVLEALFDEAPHPVQFAHVGKRAGAHRHLPQAASLGLAALEIRRKRGWPRAACARAAAVANRDPTRAPRSGSGRRRAPHTRRGDGDLSPPAQHANSERSAPRRGLAFETASGGKPGTLDQTKLAVVAACGRRSRWSGGRMSAHQSRSSASGTLPGPAPARPAPGSTARCSATAVRPRCRRSRAAPGPPASRCAGPRGHASGAFVVGNDRPGNAAVGPDRPQRCAAPVR